MSGLRNLSYIGRIMAVQLCVIGGQMVEEELLSTF